MTDIVIPDTIDALPAAPQPSDTPVDFDSKAFALLGAQVAMVAQFNGAAADTYQNATAANERAVAAAASAGAAAAAESTATAAAGTASAAADTAITKASEASASAIAASKLNLGNKATPPTVDNQGDPLLAGATYYDTTLNKWRVWSGSAWAEGISALAGVSSFNGRTGAIDDGVVLHIPAGSVDLNAITASGFYSFGTVTNGPGVADSQLIVSRGGDTATQIVVDKATGAMFVRAASALSGTPVWTAWRRVALHADVVVALAGGDIDCSKGNYFTETVAGARTLTFANIPAGSYSCVVEINHTSGAITMPAGTVWAGGATPTLATGKRHLIFFQRAQVGTAGWYASVLPGYST
ncbi:MAG: pyocin knob domain-containing protein [Acidovorax sp.]|uniref:pyocin knob domain-containing protein n=1 Tax=Acidovorax sp. TaxID=1872122 RepID=UPI00391AE921